MMELDKDIELEGKRKAPHQIKLTVTGTFELKTLAEILTKYKHSKEKYDLSDAIWEIIITAK